MKVHKNHADSSLTNECSSVFVSNINDPEQIFMLGPIPFFKPRFSELVGGVANWKAIVTTIVVVLIIINK